MGIYKLPVINHFNQRRDVQMLEKIKQIAVPGQLGDKFLDDLSEQDPTHPYYRFLHNLVKLVKATSVVELGVCTGRGTAHLASATLGRMLAIDPSPWDIQYILDRYPNIDLRKTLSTDPTLLASVQDRSVDVCFLDTLHDYGQVKAELIAWHPKMKPGGVMVFDDITLNDGMKIFWSVLALTKLELPEMHWSGFGVALA